MDLSDVFAALGETDQKKVEPKVPHYYGDTVRILFLVSAGLMLVGLPFLTAYIPVTIWISLLIILALSIFSGLTNPKVFALATIDMCIASGALLLFGYYAIDAYTRYGAGNLYFWMNQLLGLLFLFSLYYSVKTFRGFLIDHRGN